MLLFNSAMRGGNPSAGGGGGGAVQISGGTLTVTGSGFGTKSRAAPVWFDTFASATVGNRINGRTPMVGNASISTTWDDDGQDGTHWPLAQNTISRVGSKPYIEHYTYTAGSSDNWNPHIGFLHSLTANQQPMYTSFWWRCHIPGTLPRQIKPIEIFGPSDLMPLFYTSMNDDGTTHRTSFQDWNGGTPGTTKINPNEPDNEYGVCAWENVQDRWVKFEYILVQSTPNTNDGWYACRLWDPNGSYGATDYWNAQSNKASNYPITRTTSNGWRNFEYNSFSDGAEGNWFTDEVYMDDSANHRRLVLTSSSTYADLTANMENQPATSWSDTSITATFNQGAFTSGQTVYAWVVTGLGIPISGNSYSGSATLIGSTTVP